MTMMDEITRTEIETGTETFEAFEAFEALMKDYHSMQKRLQFTFCVTINAFVCVSTEWECTEELG